jgi:hypothetical protein
MDVNKQIKGCGLPSNIFVSVILEVVEVMGVSEAF